MHGPIASVLGWILKNFFKFLLIVAVLIAGNWLLSQYQAFKEMPSELSTLEEIERKATDATSAVIVSVTADAKKLRSATSQVLTDKITEIDGAIARKKAEQARLGPSVIWILKRSAGDDIVAWARLGVEVECLGQEREYLWQLRVLITWQEELKRLERELARVVRELQNNLQRQETVKKEHPFTYRIPGTAAWKELRRLKEEMGVLSTRREAIEREIARLRKVIDGLPVPANEFELRMTKIDALLGEIRQAVEKKRGALQDNFFESLSGPIKDVIYPALGVLVGLLVTPLGIKAFFYFVLAPLAERQPSICLLPSASGALECSNDSSRHGPKEARTSSASYVVSVDATNELLVHSDYLQQSSLHVRRDTKWLLDWKYPLSSIASELVVLTRIRADAPDTEVLCAPANDPLVNLGMLSLPEGSAVVLQPRCLVGVLTPRGRPVRITRHWRLTSLHAWLTLQLRYLVFHGPAGLIVKGCRGIRVETADAGRRINQAVTLGFSANLRYSTTRSRPFVAYLRSKQGLLEDSFSGERGFFVYEEMSHLLGRTGLPGRSTQALADATLKVLGI